MKIKLTQSIIDKGLHCPSDRKSIEFVDQDQPGLYIKARRGSDNHSFFLRYSNAANKTQHVLLGRVSELPLKEARAKARSLRSLIADGHDPRQEAKQRKGIPTVGQFFEEHYTPYAKPRKRSFDKDEMWWRNHVKGEFADARLDQLDPKHVSKWHTDLIEEKFLKSASADHCLKLLKRMCNLAVEWRMIPHNPLASVKPLNLYNRKEYYLSSDEIARLVATCKKQNRNMVGQLVLLLLSTGCRLNELTRARWEHYNPETRQLTIPMEHSKSRKQRTIYLNDEAISILDGLETKGSNTHLFINRRTGKPLRWVHDTFGSIREQAQLSKEVTLHSLRHTYASLLVNSGRTLYEVQAILGHSTPEVTTRYAHLAQSTLSEASNAAGEAIRRAVNQ